MIPDKTLVSERKRAARRSRAAITIHDVARAAGVSVSTVSRVLNDKEDVSPETFERVQSVIRQMGYTSSLAARSMRSHRTHLIGLIVPDVEDPFSISVMKGINQAITNIDYDLIIYTSGNIKKQWTAEREQHYVLLLNGSITDGIILVTPAATSFATTAPVIAVDPNNESPDCPSIIATNHAGAMAAMQYLIGLGHRRIGLIGGRPDLQSAIRRLRGYQDALAEAHLPLDEDLIQWGDFSAAMGYQCARRLLALPRPPTAIFASNDQSAFGTIDAAREAGLRVPEDLSVIGFDNIPQAADSNPPLTTVDQFIVRMGHVATEILIDLIDGKPLDAARCKIATELVVRNSCGPIAAGRGIAT